MSKLEDQIHDIIMQTKVDLAVVDAVEQIINLFPKLTVGTISPTTVSGSGVGLNFPGDGDGVWLM